MGIKKGEILRTPLSLYRLWNFSIAGNPPRPTPTWTPTLSAFFSVISKPESLRASSLAATAK